MFSKLNSLWLLPNELSLPGFLIGQRLDSMIKFQTGNVGVHIRPLLAFLYSIKWPSIFHSVPTRSTFLFSLIFLVQFLTFCKVFFPPQSGFPLTSSSPLTWIFWISWIFPPCMHIPQRQSQVIFLTPNLCRIAQWIKAWATKTDDLEFNSEVSSG